MKQPSAIVIGAGIGGIAVATHLAKRRMKVLVLEKVIILTPAQRCWCCRYCMKRNLLRWGSPCMTSWICSV